MTTVAASVPVLFCAAQRTRLDDADLAARFHKWPQWLSGDAQPTLKQLRTLKERSSSGGDFYRSLGARISKRFARAIVASTLEGLTSFPDASRMLGVHKTATFYEAARELGVTA